MRDAGDLEDRMRNARDWAQRQAEEHFTEDPENPEDSLARSIHEAAYQAIVRVLDQIVEPDCISNEE
jgi:hypothetical protein